MSNPPVEISYTRRSQIDQTTDEAEEASSGGDAFFSRLSQRGFDSGSAKSMLLQKVNSYAGCERPQCPFKLDATVVVAVGALFEKWTLLFDILTCFSKSGFYFSTF